MPAFTYTARAANGELKTATIEAPSREDVVAQLRRQRLSVVKVDEDAKPKKAKGSVKMRDIVIFTRQFSTMIRYFDADQNCCGDVIRRAPLNLPLFIVGASA